MRRIKGWLIQKFLPRYAYELLLEEMAKDKEKLMKASRTIEKQRAYIAGLEYALRHLRGGTMKHEAEE